MSNQNNEYVELRTIINDLHFYINWPTNFVIDQSYNNFIMIKTDIQYVYDIQTLYDQIDDILYIDLKKLIISYLTFDKIHFSMMCTKYVIVDTYQIDIQYNQNIFRFSYHFDYKSIHQYSTNENDWRWINQYDTINESDPNHIILIILYDVISHFT